MRRNALEPLKRWKTSEDRKPMILKGARQVGKTWLMKEFGQSCYQRTVYFNFDEEDELNSIFETNKNPQGTLLAQPKSYPVGMVNLLDVTPLTFDEFLEAAEPSLFAYYETIQKAQPIDLSFQPLHTLHNLLKFRRIPEDHILHMLMVLPQKGYAPLWRQQPHRARFCQFIVGRTRRIEPLLNRTTRSSSARSPYAAALTGDLSMHHRS